MIEIVKDSLTIYTTMNEINQTNMDDLKEVLKLKPTSESGTSDSLRGLKLICMWICQL